MNVTFSWTSPHPPGEDIATIEENIANEISHLLDSKPEASEDLSISLSSDPFSFSLTGTGGTVSKRVVATFTYSLQSGHLANYQYHQ